MSEFVISGRQPKPGADTPVPVAIVSGGSSGGLTDAELRASPVPVTASGVAAHGAAVSGNPVLIGGENPSGNVSRLQTASDGDLITHQHSASTTLADDVSNTMHIPVNQTDLGFMATPTAGFMFDGTAWDRIRGDSTNGLLVNLGANNDVTISGTVAVTQSGTWDEVGINDSGNSITVDAPVATPVFVRLSDGSSAISTLPVSLASVPTHAVTQSGTWTLGANSGVDIGDVTINNLTSTPVFVQHNTTALANGRTTVTTAGTRVALASSTSCKWVIITAETDNTGLIVVGSASGVIAALATRQGTPLYAGDSVTIQTDNLADIGLDSTVNGDGVTYTYGT